jgi:hypothetical protein
MRFPLAFRPHGVQYARFSEVFHSLMPETRIKSGFRASQPAAPCCTMATIAVATLDLTIEEDLWQV